MDDMKAIRVRLRVEPKPLVIPAFSRRDSYWPEPDMVGMASEPGYWSLFVDVFGGAAPHDYRAFLEEFGHGCLGGFWEFYHTGIDEKTANAITYSLVPDEWDTEFVAELRRLKFRSFASAQTVRQQIGWCVGGRTPVRDFGPVLAVDIESERIEVVGRDFAGAMISWMDGVWPKTDWHW